MVTFLFSSGIQAQTTISTHGPLTIEACGSFPSVSTSIPYSLTISETTSDGFAITSGSKTFQIALPENFTFSGTVSFSETGDDISSISANIDSDARYILVTYTTTATNTLDVITLSGLFVVAASAAQSGNVTYLAGTAVINGLTSGDLFFPIASASAPINVTGGTLSATQTYCLDEPSSVLTVSGGTTSATTSNVLTYQWESGPNDSSFSSLDTHTGPTYQPLTNVVGTTFYRRKITETSNGLSCVAYSSVVSVSVKTLDAGEISGTEEVCYNGVPGSITSVRDASVEGEVVTYDWEQSIDNGVSWTTAPSTNSTTYVFGSNTLTQTTQFRRIAFSTSCTVTKSTNIITKTAFGPLDGGTITPTIQLLYKGTTPASLTVSSTTNSGNVSGTLSYQWQQSTDSVNFTNIDNSTGDTYLPLTTQTGTTYFKRLTKLTNGSVICEEESTVGSVTVYDLNPGSIIGDQSLCNDHLASDITSIGSVDGNVSPPDAGNPVTYTWESSLDNVAWSTMGGETSTTLDFTNALTQTTYYKRIASIDAGTVTRSTNVIAKTLLLAVVGGTMDTVSTTLCVGEALPNLTVSGSTATGGPTYQWEYSSDNISFSTLDGVTGDAHTPTQTATGTHYFRRITTVTSSGVACSATSSVTTIIIKGLSPGSIGSEQNICYNDTPNELTSTSAANAAGDPITYTWQTAAASSGPWSTASGTSSSTTYQPAALTQTTFYRRLANSTSCSISATTNIIKINVVPAVVGGTMATASETICVGSTPTELVVNGATSAGVLTYQWETSSDNNTFSTITGATSINYTPVTPTAAGTTYYRRQITLSSDGGFCSATSSVTTLIAKGITSGTIGSDKTVCYNTTGGLLTSLTAADASGETPIYSWQKSIDSGSNWTVIGSASDPTYTVGTITQTTQFRRLASSPTCTVSATTTPITITVLTEVVGGTAAGSQSVCLDATPLALSVTGHTSSGGTLSYQWQKSSSVATNTFSDINLTNARNEQYTPPTDATGTVYYRRITNITSGSETCFAASSVVSVTVTDVLGGVQATPSQTVCSGSPVTDLTITGGSGLAGEVYQWQMSRTDTASNSFTNLSGVTGAVYTPSNTQTGTTYYRRVTSVTGSSCVAYSDAATVIIVDFTPGVIASNETLCYGGTASSITVATPAAVIGGTEAISYTWQQKIGAGAWTTAVGTSNGSTYSPGTLTQTTKYRRVVSIASCTATKTTNEITKTVLDELTAGTADTATHTVCLNDTRPVLAITGGSGSTTYQWQSSSTTGTGFTNISGATNSSYQAPTDVAGTTYYRRLITQSQGGANCDATSTEFEVIVAAINAGSISGAATVCYNGDGGTIGSTLDASLGTDVISYTWQKSINAGGDWMVVSGQTSTTIAVGTLTQTSLFRRVALGTTCTVTATTSAVQITVVPEVLGGTASGNQTVCVGETANGLSVTGASTVGGVGNTLSYQWQSSTTNVGVSFTNATTGSGITSATYIPSTTVTGTVYYRRITNITSGSETCFAASSVVSVTVTDVLGGVQATPSQTVCSGSPVTDLTITGGSGLAGEVYQWQMSRTDTASNSFTNLSGVTGAVYTPSNTQTGTTYYRRVTSVTGSSCVAYSDAATVIIVDFTPGVIASNETLCYGGTASSITVATPAAVIGGTEAISYTWQQKIGAGAWTTAVGTSNGSTYSPGTLTQTTKYRRVVSIASCTATKTTNEITKTVLDELTAGTADTATHTVCLNDTRPVLAITGGSGSTTYQWQSSSTTGTGFTNISGATNSSYQAPTDVAGTTYYRRLITQSQGGANCDATSTEFEVIVAAINAGSISGAATVCYNGDGGTIGSTLDASLGTDVISYTWQKSINAGGDWMVVSGQTSTTIAVGTLTQTSLFRRVALGTTCTVTATTSAVQITVVPEVLGGTASGNQTVCVGETANGLSVTGASTVGGVGNTLSYQWQSSTTNVGVSFTNATTGSGITSATYIPSTTVTGTVYYRRITNITSGSETCFAASSVVSVTVTDVLGGVQATPSQTVCSGSPVTDLTITGGSGLAGEVYQWQMSRTDTASNSFTNLSGVTGAVYTPSNTQTGTTYYRRVTSVTGSSCVAYSDAATVIIVDFTPGVIASNETLCYGGTASSITVATPAAVIGGTEAISYTWQQKIGAGAWTTAVGTSNGSTYSPGTLTQTTKYRRVVSIASCTATKTTNEITKTVLDEVDGGTFNSAVQIVCQNEVPTTLTITSVTNSGNVSGTLKYRWQSSPDNNLANFTDIPGTAAENSSFVPSTTATGTTYYRRTTTLDFNSKVCTQYSDIQLFTVIGLDPGDINGGQELCYGETLGNITPIGNLRSALVTPSTLGETITYVFQQSTDAGSNWSQIQSGANPSYSFTTTLTQTTWFRRLASTPNCSNTVTSSTVIKNVTSELIGGTITADQTICVGETPTTLTVTTATNSATVSGTLSYKWQSSRTNIPANFQNLTDANSTGIDYVPANSATATGTTYYRRQMTIAGSNCEVFSAVSAVTVVGIDAGTITAISYACQNEEVTIGSTQDATTEGGISESITYTWQKQIGTGAWEDLLANTTNTNYTIAAAQMTQTANYRRLALSTNCGGQSNPSNTLQIQVLPTIIAGTVSLTASGPTTICENEAPGELTVVNGTNTSTFNLRFQWLSRISPTGTYTNVSGAVGNVYNPGTLTQTTFFIRQAYFEERPSCTINSAELQITVPQINAGTITGTQVICQSDTNILIASTAGATVSDGSSVSYTWQVADRLNEPDLWTAVLIGTVTQTGESLTIPSAPSSNTVHYRRMAEIDGQSCPSYSNEVTIKINRFSNASNIRFSNFGYQNIQLCGDQDIPALGFSGSQGGTGSLSYVWEISPDNSSSWQTMTPTTQSISAQEIADKITAMGTGFQKDYYFRRTTTSVLDGKACTVVSNIASALYGSEDLEVNPGSINIYLSEANNNLTEQVICSGSTAGTISGSIATASIGNVSPTTDLQVYYSWFSRNQNDNIYRQISGVNTQSYTPSNVFTQTTYIKRVVSVEDPYDECSYVSANIITIIVPQSKQITSAADQTIVCAGDDLGRLVTVGTIPAMERDAMSFKWYKKAQSEDSFSLITGQNAETLAPDPITETTTFRREITVTISGTDNPTCNTGPFTADYTITVNHADPGEIIYNGTLRAGTTDIIDLCYGADHAGFNSNGAKDWDVFGEPVFEWYTSSDGVDYSSVNVLTETYPASTITQTIWIKRRISSVYTYTIDTNVVTSTCTGVSTETSFTNIFKINVLPRVEKPTLTATVNAQICATNLSPGSITISNMYSPTSDGVVYEWYTSKNKTTWESIKDPLDITKIYGGETLELPQLLQNTYYEVRSYVLSDTLCRDVSDIFEVNVINITPGVIAFTTPTAQENYYQICDDATPVLTITAKSGFNHSVYPNTSTFTVTWQSKPKDGVSGYTDITFNDQLSSPTFATLTARNMTESIYIRKKIAVLNDAGDILCEEFTNGVLIDYMPEPVVNIPDPSIFVTDPSCFDGTDGSITINPTAITGGTPTDRAQSVRITLSGSYSTTATFRTTIAGINYDFTATASNTSINSITASITAVLTNALSNTLDITSVNNLITLTAKDATQDFSIQTTIINNTKSIFNLEYLDTRALANSYSWKKFTGDTGTIVDSGFTNPGTLNLTNLAAGRYELTVTNNLDCTAVTVSPTFNLINPNPIVAGTLTSSLGDLVCEGAIPLLSVPGLTLPPNPIYIWERSLNGTNNWTVIKNGAATVTTATYSVSTTLTQTTYFRRGINSNLSAGVNCAPEYSFTEPLKIEINIATPGTIQYAGNSDNGVIEVCYNTAPLEFSNGATPYTVSGAASFEWYQSIDGGNTWALIPNATEQAYTPPALTQTTQFRRKVLSNILVGTATLTCDDSNEEDNFSNSFTVEVKEAIPTPAVVSSVNTVCASDLSRGLLSINNITAVDAVAGIEKQWERFTTLNGWVPIRDENGNIENGSTYRLPTLTETTRFRVVVQYTATGVNSATCVTPSNAVTVTVINIDPGTISFLDTPVVENVYNTCTSLANPIVLGANGAGNQASVPDYETTYESFWETKDTSGTGVWSPLALSGNFSGSDRNRVLTISNSLAASIYVRRGIRQEITPGSGLYCTEYSNVVLINLLDAPVVTIPDPTALITVPSCPGDSDGAITISPTAITGGSQTAQAQKVNLELSGAYTQAGIYTPTGRYEVTINSTTYSYTATASNTTLESLTASITAAIDSGPLVAVSSSGKIITLTASNTAVPFTVSTNITNLGTNTRFRVEYVTPALSVNTYKWEKLLGAVGTAVDNTVTLSNTLSLTGLNAGRYRLTVTNNTTCASTEAPIFTVVDKTIVPGTITANTGNVLCTDHSGFTLTVTGDSSNIGETYLWQQSTDGVSGWTNVLSGTSSITTATATIGLLTDTTFYRRAVRIENGGVPCTTDYTYTPVYEMIVNKSTPGAIATEELLVCAGSVPSIPISETAAATNNSRGVITYLWESKANSPSSDWTTVAGASAASLTLTTPINLTTAFRRIVVNTINSVACNSIPSNVVTITTVTPTTIDNATIRTSRILNVSCNGLSDGSINVALTDFTTDHPNPSFLWTKVGDPSFRLNTMAATALGAGTYNLTISTYTNTIAGAIVPVCQAVSENFIITEPAPLTLTVSATCEGNIVATGAGGLENYIYTLTAANQAPTSVAVTGGGAHTFLNLIKGATYTVTLAENGTRVCSPISEAVTMPTDLVIDTAQITTEDATCFGINDGSIAITEPFISGGTGRYSYEWTGPAGATYFTRDINNLAPGQYDLVVTDALGCTATFNATIGSKAELEISREVVTNQVLSCSTATDASIDVEVSPLDRNVEYKWTLQDGTTVAGSGNSGSVSNLGPGNYILTITDLDSPDGACQLVQRYTISAPTELQAEEVSVVSPSCFSANGGTATYTVSGGTPPYKYSIDGGAEVSFGTASQTSINKEITGIAAGPHTIIFSDSNVNCDTGTDVVSFSVNISIPEEIEIDYNESSDLVPIPCGGSGSISVAVSGGVGPYSYQWSGPNLNRITSVGTLPVSTGGAYTLTVTDANQCTKSLQITVPPQEGSFTVAGTINQSQCSIDAADASIQLTVTGAISPLSIAWQKWTLKSAAGGVVSTTTSTCTTNCYEWANVDGSDGKLLLDNLTPGEYRVSITDANTSACNTVVKTFSISTSSLELYNTRIIPPSCEVETGAYVFKVKHNNGIKILLNGTELTVTSGTIKYNNTLKQYTIPELLGGSYLLRIIEQIPTGSTSPTTFTDGCEIFENFTLGAFEEITYQGATDLILDVCDPSGQTFPDPSLVSGGVPFVNASQEPYYIYRWTGITTGSLPSTGTTTSTTATSTTASSTTASGTTASATSSAASSFSAGSISLLSTEPVPLAPGNYSLVIEDAQGCLSDPIPFLIEANVKPIKVTVSRQELNCGLNNTDGAFAISIEGGAAPYTITWEKEIPGDETDPNPTYELIGTNLLNINNLGEGRYRLRITSGIANCQDAAASEFTAIYSLFKSDTITILDGPFLSRELCIGEPGTLNIKVFDSQSDNFSFRYAGELVTGTFVGEDTYRVVIASPQEEAILDIVNDRGCAVQVPIITGVGEPDFSYTSLSLEQSNTLIPNQDITFTNTSEDLYTKLQFNFGDGSPVLEVTAENEATTDIVHRYKTPGTFYVTMRFYNNLGCYKETEQEIIVGQGYLVIFPTAFSPNADGVNDIFFGEYTGLTAFNFEVYDMWGNLIYSKIIEDVTLKEAWGWDGNYATGEPYPYQTFRYVFTGTTYSEKTVVESGEVTLLR